MQRLMLMSVWRAAFPALAVAALLAPGTTARALPLPTGLGGGCTLEGCGGAQYWDPDAGGNGHYYAFVAADGPSWFVARDEAAGSSIGPGTRGHLVTIGDAEENAFIQSQILPLGYTHKRQVWLGAAQAAAAVTPEVDWRWIDPGNWDYAHWTPGEPNDENDVHTGREEYLTMWVHYYVAATSQTAIDMRGMWNDEGPMSHASSPIVGYIVEWEATSTPVPEPAAALLALLGLGLCARRARR